MSIKYNEYYGVSLSIKLDAHESHLKCYLKITDAQCPHPKILNCMMRHQYYNFEQTSQVIYNKES